MIQKLLITLVEQIVETGHVRVEFADGVARTFGDGSGPPIVARFTDARGPFDLMRNPELALGELYTDGRLVLVQGTVLDLLTVLLSNAARRGPPPLLKPIRALRKALLAVLPRNDKPRASTNVHRHYDLDGGLYDLFLDRDRQYSCAYFEKADISLEEAQLAKKRHIAAKLCIAPGQSVLDIGCGWGGMARYLARYCSADVTGITLSQEQFALASAHPENQKFSDRVRFRLEDYRDTTGKFDRVVSVGMFEHVGPADYVTFFSKVASLLTDDGVAIVHTIGRPDGPGPVNPWITKHIFPGGHVPSLSEIAAAVEKSGIFITDLEVLRMHYAETLRAWRERLAARREDVVRLYDARFYRMWEFYLSICELAFRVEGKRVFQIQLTRRHDALPITRDYISAREAQLREQDVADLHGATAA